MATLNPNYDATLNAQNENMVYVRRSYMYEFIILFIISIIVLSITIRNLSSDTTTNGGYIICYIILFIFAIGVIAYFLQLCNIIPQQSGGGYSNASGGGGPVIRIHYM